MCNLDVTERWEGSGGVMTGCGTWEITGRRKVWVNCADGSIDPCYEGFEVVNDEHVFYVRVTCVEGQQRWSYSLDGENWVDNALSITFFDGACEGGSWDHDTDSGCSTESPRALTRHHFDVSISGNAACGGSG